MDVKKVLGEFSCAYCGYRDSDPLRIKKHIDDVHEGESITKKYREVFRI